MQLNRNSRPTVMELGEACLMHLINDPPELARFMSVAGYDADGLREAVGTEPLALGLLDYFASNEPLMLAVCTGNRIKPENFMRVWQAHNQSQ